MQQHFTFDLILTVLSTARLSLHSPDQKDDKNKAWYTAADASGSSISLILAARVCVWVCVCVCEWVYVRVFRYPSSLRLR